MGLLFRSPLNLMDHSRKSRKKTGVMYDIGGMGNARYIIIDLFAKKKLFVGNMWCFYLIKVDLIYLTYTM